MRLLLFLVSLALLQFVMGGWLLVIVAAVVSALVAYLALGKFRDASAAYLAGAAERRASGINSPGTDDADEDREADALERNSRTIKPYEEGSR